MVCVTLEGLWMVSDRIVDLVSELSQRMSVMHQKLPNQEKDLINTVSVTLDG